MSLETSWLDIKLGLRMLARHPILTLIGVVATSLAITGAGAYFEIVNDFSYPTLPFADGARVITILNEDLESASPEGRSLHDFVSWRQELKSVQDLAAFTIYSRNLAIEGRTPEPIEVVEISAAAFRVAQIAPLLGRSIDETDEQPNSPPIVLIGERLWETRFGRDPNVVGKSVELGTSRRTIVGVMPKGFALPVNQTLWVPFRIDPLNYPRRQGPEIGTIGRLAPGTTIKTAQAELTILGDRLAAEFAQSNNRLRPRIKPYLTLFTGDPLERQVRLGVNAVFIALIALICGNIGALVFARIATRETEFIVRTALGASRRRIIMQLFVEALVLTSAGAAVALAFLRWGLRNAAGFVWAMEGVAPPFWHNDNLNGTTILYVALLTLLGAVVTGVLPALRFTRGSIEANSRRSAVGGSGMQSRRMSTGVIVIQVALSGALLPMALALTLQLNWEAPNIPSIRTEEYLTLRYQTAEPERFTATYQSLKERLLAETGITRVTFSDQLPGSSNPGRLIEVDNEDGRASDEHRVRVATVDLDFFDALDSPILAGRGFNPGDLAVKDTVIVNQPFVQAVLGGRNPIGRRLRYTGSERRQPPSRWYEIVGVVPDLGMSPREPYEAKGIYHPAGPADMSSGFMAMRIGSNPAAFGQTFRAIAADIDRGFLIYDMRSLDQIGKAELLLDRAFYILVTSGVYFIVFLSAAVTFALMSFTVSQRAREIGIRKALGASSRAILTAVFSRAVVQLGLGAGCGAMASLVMFSRIPDTHMAEPGMVFTVVGVMLLVGFASCVAPAVRVLRIDPTKAIRDE